MVTAADPGAGVRIDVDAVTRAVVRAEDVRAPFPPEVGEIEQLRRLVEATAGIAMPGLDGLALLSRLLDDNAATESEISAVVRSVMAADVPLELAPAAHGSPWLDPHTDAWTVNLVRTVTGGRPSAPFLERLGAEIPDLLAHASDTELTVANQVHLSVHEPDRFLANWTRALDGAVDATVGLATGVTGAVATILPGGDEVTEALIGRRLGDEMRAAVAAGLAGIVTDPDAVAESAVGWETLTTDPYRWIGEQIPGAVLEGLTPGVPILLTTRPARAARHLLPPVPLRRPGLAPWAGPGARRSPMSSVAGAPPAPGSPYPDLAIVRRREGIWGPVEDAPVRRAPFETPETWVDDINGGGHHLPGRDVNCIDCTRATESTWRGQPEVAAPIADPSRRGAPLDWIEDWSGGRFRLSSADGVARRLDDLGPGSSAMIVATWSDEGAHAFNAVNDGGTIRWVDGQTGETLPWPPRYGSEIDTMLAIFVDPDGRLP